MKIGINALSLEPSHNGGAESVLLNLAKGFKKIGYGNNIVYFCYDKLAERLKEIAQDSEIIVVDYMGVAKHERTGVLKTQAKWFHKNYKKYQLDLILFANAGIGRGRYNVPAVIIPHDIQSVSRRESNSSFLKFLINYILFFDDFCKASKIVSISRDDESNIRKYFPVLKNKVVQIYNPLDVCYKEERFNVSREKYIFAVNIQYEHKNIITLIKAYEIIKHRIPEMKLYLAGAFNEYTKTLRKYVEDKKIDGVHFLGFISKSDLESYWTKASIYVNPSLFEGFGMTSVESIIYGTPTLLSELAVNREVTDGLCYFYDDITNPDKLASQIISIINDNYDADSYREKSQKLAEKYSVSNIARQYVDLFENVSGVKKDKC